MATTKDGRQITTTRDDDQNRYVASVDGEPAAFVEFMRGGDVVVLTHTEALPGFDGQGVASGLVRDALDDIRGHGYLVRPTCPYVARWIEKHPGEYDDLVHHSAG